MDFLLFTPQVQGVRLPLPPWVLGITCCQSFEDFQQELADKVNKEKAIAIAKEKERNIGRPTPHPSLLEAETILAEMKQKMEEMKETMDEMTNEVAASSAVTEAPYVVSCGHTHAHSFNGNIGSYRKFLSNNSSGKYLFH